METTQTISEQKQMLIDFKKVLLQNGFTVIEPTKNEYQWMHFEKDGKIGYVGASTWRGRLSFSTVHKPCKGVGTGFGIADEVFNPTIKNAEDCLVNAPGWGMKERQHVKKYADLKEFLDTKTTWYDYTVTKPETTN